MHHILIKCNTFELSSDELQLLEKQPTQNALNRLSEISANTNWTRLLLKGRARSTMPDSVKCALHIRKEVKQDAFVNSVLFCFTNSLSLRNTTLLGTK